MANLGCDAVSKSDRWALTLLTPKYKSDYPAPLTGKIALISRGTCQFGLKSALAGAAGADAAIIYNNVEGDLAGTLGAPPRPEGPYVPTAGISLANGTALLNSIKGGATVVADLTIFSIIENRIT